MCFETRKPQMATREKFDEVLSCPVSKGMRQLVERLAVLEGRSNASAVRELIKAGAAVRLSKQEPVDAVADAHP
jgi:hypothetical protein